MSLLVNVNTQWRYKSFNSKYDGNYSIVSAPLIKLDDGLATELKLECDLDSDPHLLIFYIKGKYFCDEKTSVRWQVENGENIEEYNLVAMSTNGRTTLTLGEYSYRGLENLVESLKKGSEARITIYSGSCGKNSYLVKLSGSSASISNILNDYKTNAPVIKEHSIESINNEVDLQEGYVTINSVDLLDDKLQWLRVISEPTEVKITGKEKTDGIYSYFAQIEIDGKTYWINRNSLK
jgi:hypothetical protein